MKIRIPFAVALTALILMSCDEPVAFENDNYTYNPFSFTQDTLNNITAMTAGEADVEWGSHFRAWVGETKYYKSGYTVEFVFPDTLADMAGLDSVQFKMQHVKTYPENGADTLVANESAFGFYETMDQTIDVENSQYGNFLGTGTMNIAGENNFWNYTLPGDLIAAGDTSVSLGVFPAITDYFSSVYGGGSVSRPTLSFFSHQPDTSGEDSVTFITYLADTLHMHLSEKSDAFDRVTYNYLNQLKTDSVQMTLNLQELNVAGDTLQHIINSSIFPAINLAASSLYMPDSLFRFSMLVEDPLSGYSATIEYAGDDYNSNELKLLVQSALDEDQSTFDMILRPSNPGYNPGFIAISKDVTESSLYVRSSLAVRP